MTSHQQQRQDPVPHAGRTARVPRPLRAGRVALATALAGLAVAGAFGLDHRAPGRTVASPAAPAAAPSPSRSLPPAAPTTGPVSTPASGPVSAPASGPLSAPPRTAFPQRGAGTFTRAGGGTHVAGRGTLMRYAVDVEDGIGQDPQHFAEQVDAVLDDTARGWAAGGQWAFQRVSRGRVDFTVHLASPHTTDVICGGYGLDTGGWVNCSGGHDVVINVKRWLLLSPYYRGRADLYHALAINHEVGHRLGHNHESCPGVGAPAPVMMQQIKGLHGCVINGWPYDGHGRPITGPLAR